METWLAASAATTLLWFALMRVKLYISVVYRRAGGDDSLAVEVYVPGRLLVYRMEVPVIRIIEAGALPWLESRVATRRGAAETRPKAERRFVRTTWEIFRNHSSHWRFLVRQFRHYTRMYNRLMRRLLRATACEKLCWRTRYGADDAALTGVTAGFIWIAKNEVYKYMKRRLAGVARPVFRVVPLYGRTAFEVELQCIFSIRLGNVINATTTVIQSAGKGANREWANTRSKAL